MKGQTLSDPSLTLWYNQPSNTWNDALPVGNGRLGAMVYGGKTKEVIQFNEETLWSGQPHDYVNRRAFKSLAKIKNSLWDGKRKEAEEIANKKFMSNPINQSSYQSFANVLIDFKNHSNVTDYKRSLDLERAIASTVYKLDKAVIKREVFASHPDQVIVVHLTSSVKGILNFDITLDSNHSDYKVSIEENEIVIKGKADNFKRDLDINKNKFPLSKIKFEARLKLVQKGGELISKNNKVTIKNATEVTCYLVGATNFVNFKDISGNPHKRCKEYFKKLNNKPYNLVKENHIKDFQKYFNRLHIDLGETKISRRPTNERLMSFSQDMDPNLVALLYQYGRYLLISSSRKGTQPANLQGIWNDRISPPWGSKYTLNINLEMNYWITEVTNLSELSEPLIKLIDDLSNTGEKIAKEHYNMPGWVAHHNTDIWRGAAPINRSNHGIWPTGGAWLSQHLWWHYEFTQNKDFLKKMAYPILKKASLFFSNYLLEFPDNKELLISGPSNSPEHGGLVMGPTMDHQIIRNLFRVTIEASKILNVDRGFRMKLEKKMNRIMPNKIGKHGQLQEWVKDIDNPKDKHRHISHLWGLHPGSEIHPLTTPELAEACKITLQNRGDGGTGWSKAWKINFWARLLDGDHSFQLLKELVVPVKKSVDKNKKGGLYLNLFDAHPPFQIDGNFGITSGITEMILQNHLKNSKGETIIDILPALPSRISKGEIFGLKARGNFEVSILWKERELSKVVVKSINGGKLNLRYKKNVITKNTNRGDVLTFSPNDFKK
ncbi:glycoside hydrolase family 95 protein [Ochrovirga pacifica]|uniref:glycoside hydrolase family 95 protein n=1 Tax=Ochrovirga pacifica TaxID=1042376 RepID=UPI0002E9189D|nr:glycoside hydrolase family 95 protein [Ochrovirga pacifica]